MRDYEIWPHIAQCTKLRLHAIMHAVKDRLKELEEEE